MHKLHAGPDLGPFSCVRPRLLILQLSLQKPRRITTAEYGSGNVSSTYRVYIKRSQFNHVLASKIRIEDAPENVHNRWDRNLRPIATVEEGDTVVFECRDGTDDQLYKDSTTDDLRKVDFGRVHPLSGPVCVKGAKPGDVIEVEVLGVNLRRDWGFTVVLPGVGNGLIPQDQWASLLDANEYQSPYLKIWRLSGNEANFGHGISIPTAPFMGIMGVAPERNGVYRTIPPTKAGGNMDIKQLIVGSRLFLPVLNEGALFSAGDGHAAQGDGEVCSTAVETAVEFTCKFSIHENWNLPWPRAIIPPQPSEVDERGSYLTMGINRDANVATREAVKEMVDWVQREHNLTLEEAYVLTSVAGNLKVSESVDVPNWVISMVLSRSIFGSK